MPPRTLVIPALLLVAAVVLGGVAGVLAAFVAALLLLDHWLERATNRFGWRMSEAEQDFRRLSRERRRAARRLRRRPHDPNRLAYLALETGWAAVAQRRRLGLRTIALESIVGTVDRRKAVAFDGCFRPPDWSRGRWTLMCLAARRGETLPPIAVYRVGDEHFVRDGHHRVSVASALGAADIDADVVELRRPVPPA
jgi:hypothetical protein